MRIEAAIFDFGRTIYDPETKDLFSNSKTTLYNLRDRKLKLGLVTVALTDDLQLRKSELDTLGLTEIFDIVDIVGRNTEGKDFMNVIKYLNLTNKSYKCLVVGDNLKREITSGNKMGAYTVWTKQRLSADWFPQNKIQIPKTTIYKIEELIPLVDILNS